jgi:phosphopantothenoylcysteine decarboxylase / phosphopantothenate---cysteine ligase
MISRMARIILGVTGGIAAYKACELTRLLVKEGHDVLPVVTRGAKRFVAAETFYALARTERPSDPYPHLQRADLLVIAPLTAHTMARLAAGLADDVLTEAALAHRGPVLVAPAMNTGMWEHPATQDNLAILVDRGVHVVGPASGDLAEGEVGMGRMAEPAAILAQITRILAEREPAGDADAGSRTGRAAPSTGPLKGKQVLITAGGTREPLDAVRYVGNRSSGRMGVALAVEARRRGGEVTLLACNLTVPAPDGVVVVPTPTAADLRREALDRHDADVILMAAAVADYKPAERVEGKRPKDGEPWLVELVPTADVARALGAIRNPTQVLVAFGAEAGDAGRERKRGMLDTKNVDLVVYNDVSRSDIGFDAADNEVVLLSREADVVIAKASKTDVAAAILDRIEDLLRSRG